jgi:hypothetical protein
MEEADFSSEMLATLYQTTWRHNTEANNPIKIHGGGRDVKSHTNILITL